MAEIDRPLKKEQEYESNEYYEMMRKDRLGDYAPRPLIPANAIRFANGGKYWENKDKTH